MRINLNYDAFDRIMKATKPFVAKGGARVAYTQLRLESTGEKVTVTALDGVKAVQLTVDAENGTEYGKMLIPWMKPIGKKGAYAQLIDDKGSITVQTELEMRTFRKVQEEYMNTDWLFKIDEAPAVTFFYDPRELSEALSAFTDKVRIDYLGPRRGLVISDLAHNQRALVLPMKPPEELY